MFEHSKLAHLPWAKEAHLDTINNLGEAIASLGDEFDAMTDFGIHLEFDFNDLEEADINDISWQDLCDILCE